MGCNGSKPDAPTPTRTLPLNTKGTLSVKAVRHLLLYDTAGSQRDAFSLALREQQLVLVGETLSLRRLSLVVAGW